MPAEKPNEMQTTGYKGWTIERFQHPKLTGKYSIFDSDSVEVCRAHTIKEEKAIITKSKQKQKK